MCIGLAFVSWLFCFLAFLAIPIACLNFLSFYTHYAHVSMHAYIMKAMFTNTYDDVQITHNRNNNNNLLYIRIEQTLKLAPLIQFWLSPCINNTQTGISYKMT